MYTHTHIHTYTYTYITSIHKFAFKTEYYDYIRCSFFTLVNDVILLLFWRKASNTRLGEIARIPLQ